VIAHLIITFKCSQVTESTSDYRAAYALTSPDWPVRRLPSRDLDVAPRLARRIAPTRSALFGRTVCRGSARCELCGSRKSISKSRSEIAASASVAAAMNDVEENQIQVLETKSARQRARSFARWSRTASSRAAAKGCALTGARAVRFAAQRTVGLGAPGSRRRGALGTVSMSSPFRFARRTVCVHANDGPRGRRARRSAQSVALAASLRGRRSAASTTRLRPPRLAA
jgi:hypothetical protein